MNVELLTLKKDLNGKAPTEFVVLPEGKIEMHGKPPAFMKPEQGQMIIQEFAENGVDMVIDYEHQTLKDDIAPASGWIHCLEWENGIKVKCRWTDKAKQMIEAKEYRYFSPVFYVDTSTRDVVMLVNVALTNQPRMKHIEALVAKRNVNFMNPKKEDETMTKEEMQKFNELLKVGDEPTPDTLIEALKQVIDESQKDKSTIETMKAKLDKQPTAGNDILEALKLDASTDNAVVVAKINALMGVESSSSELAAKLAAQETVIAKMQADSMINEAISKGKVSKSELDNWANDLAMKSPEQFKQIVLSRKDFSIVPMQPTSSTTVPPSNAMSDAQLEINKMLGISDDQFKKYGGE